MALGAAHRLRAGAERFDADAARAYASEVLSRPPARPHIVRPEPAGQLVARFVLPLELCLPTNRIARAGMASSKWRLAKLKDSCLSVMAGQWLRQRQGWQVPLGGRPQVLCVRFSSVEPDRFNDGFKVPIDRLRAAKGGLGIIVDDSPKRVQVEQWWEYAPKARGFGMLEVWTG